MKNTCRIFIVAGLGCSWMFPGIVSAGQDGELWETKTVTTMSDMPPEQRVFTDTDRECVRKGWRPTKETFLKNDGEEDDEKCTVTSFNDSGSKISYAIECQGESSSKIKGEMSSPKGGRYEGSARISTLRDGKPFEMNQKFSGKLVGSCTYVDEGALKREARCDQSAQEGDWVAFAEKGQCVAYKSKLCDRMKNLENPKKFDQFAAQEDWQKGLSFCGMKATEVQAKACKRAKAEKNYDFIADYCEEDARVLAKANCAGRDYTSANQAGYGQLCMKYAADELERNKGSSKSSAPDAAQQGIDGLKKLLRF